MWRCLWAQSDDGDDGNESPVGLWGDGSTLWVSNNGFGSNNKIYAYDRAGGSRVAALDFDALGHSGNGDPRGIASDGVSMFVVDKDDNRVRDYPMRRFAAERDDRKFRLTHHNRRSSRGVDRRGVDADRGRGR